MHLTLSIALELEIFEPTKFWADRLKLEDCPVNPETLNEVTAEPLAVCAGIVSATTTAAIKEIRNLLMAPTKSFSRCYQCEL